MMGGAAAAIGLVAQAGGALLQFEGISHARIQGLRVRVEPIRRARRTSTPVSRRSGRTAEGR